jgi:hypothetical protein
LEHHGVGDCLPKGHEPGLGLPDLNEPIGDRVERLPGIGQRIGQMRAGGLVDGGEEPDLREPRVGVPVFLIGDRVDQVAVDLVEAFVVQTSHHGEVRSLVWGNRPVCRPENEGLVAIIPTAVQEVRGLGIGPGDDDSRHTHDVQLKPSGVQALDLLILGDQDLPALMAAFLGAGLLVLDVVARHADLDEPPNQIAHMSIPTVASVGISDDEGRKIDLGCAVALGLGHARARKVLVPICGQ